MVTWNELWTYPDFDYDILEDLDFFPYFTNRQTDLRVEVFMEMFPTLDFPEVRTDRDWHMALVCPLSKELVFKMEQYYNIDSCYFSYFHQHVSENGLSPEEALKCLNMALERFPDKKAVEQYRKNSGKGVV